VTESLTSNTHRQQIGSGHCNTTPASNFTFDVLPTPCDLNIGNVTCCTPVLGIILCFVIGTSQEAREEKEKTEAFSRLHQGRNVLMHYKCNY